MAYSNTNRDKTQHDWTKPVKLALLTVMAVVVLVSSIDSIYQQEISLLKAKNRNKEMELKLGELSKENRKLTRQIEEATSSAKIMRESREVLGLGTEGDYWLILPDVPDQVLNNQPTVGMEPKLIILQWWELFARRK